MNSPQSKLQSLILAFVLGSLLGCVKPRVILIPPNEPVQLSRDVEAYVFVPLQDGTAPEAKIMLKAGQWVVTDQ